MKVNSTNFLEFFTYQFIELVSKPNPIQTAGHNRLRKILQLELQTMSSLGPLSFFGFLSLNFFLF